MKATGIIRKVDELGRIVLPIELRRSLDIADRDELEIFVEGDSVILRKHESSCIFCDRAAARIFQGKSICASCLQELYDLVVDE